MATIEQKALTLLEDFELDVLPIDIDKLAVYLELEIIEEDFEDNISGILYSKGEKSYIGLNKNHHENRRRFTLGHEIGHYILLHHKSNDIHIDNKLFIFRSSDKTSDNEQDEKDANKFSASLLLPSALLKKFIKKEKIDLNDNIDIYKLATKLKISEQALTYRLLNLGLINYL